MLNQPSTSDTNKGERKSGLRGKEEGKCNGDHTKQLLRSSPSKRSILNVIKLPKLKSFSRPAPREIKVAKTTTETDVVVPVIQGGDSGSDTFVIQGGDRIAALKKRLFEQQNQHMTTKRPSVPLIKSMSDGNVARKRRSLHKVSFFLFNFVVLVSQCELLSIIIICSSKQCLYSKLRSIEYCAGNN